MVFSLHRAEIGYVQFKNHCYLDAIQNIFQLLLYPTALCYQLEKIIIRTKSKVKI